MDKYNVIEPTNDLAKLNQDITDWNYLPFDMRMRANDSCIARYGCTVTDLYNKIKASIVNADSEEDQDSDNIVKEAVGKEENDFTYDQEKLNYSANLQQSPYIVIIDPTDCKDQAELDAKYNSFWSLNHNARLMSNGYSTQIWGYNVPNMYNRMCNIIANNDANMDKPNIVFNLDESAKVESVMQYNIDEYSASYINHDVIKMERLLEDTSIKENHIANHIMESNIVDYKNFDRFCLGKVVPMFTPNEIDKFDITLTNPDNYYKALKESAGDEKARLSLGWLDCEINESNLNIAKERLCKWFDNHLVQEVNVSDINNMDKMYTDYAEYRVSADNSLKPIYFILGYPENYNEFANRCHYNKAGISFNLNLDIIYTFSGEEDGFTTIKVESLNNYQYIDVVMMYLDNDIYTKLVDNISNAAKSGVIPGFVSIYGIINRAVINSFSPDAIRLIYSQYIDMLLRVTSIDVADGPKFMVSMKKNLRVFKIYSGSALEYKSNLNRLINIVNIVSNDDARNQYAESHNISDSVKDVLIPQSIIVEKQ